MAEPREIVVARVQGKKSDNTYEDIITDDAGRLQVKDPKVGSLISYEGTTTADGADDGSTLVCSDLTTKPDFDGNLVIITSGAYKGQAKDINGLTTGGTVTPSKAFGGKIVSGTTFVIVGITTTPAEVAAIEAKLDGVSGLAAIKAVVDAILVDTGTTLETKLDNIKTVVDAILVDTSTTLEGKLDAIGGIVSAILVDTGTTLEGKLDALALICTAARGLLIDRLSLLAAGGAGELTAARAAALQRLIDDLTAVRAGYLDNINQVGLLQLTAARAALLDQITALRMAELDAANIPTDLANIIAYVDLIDDVTNGLAAIKAEVEGLAGAAMRGTDGAALAASWTAGLATILGNFTAANIGYLANINNAQLLNITATRLGYIDLLATLTAARIGYLDNINQVGLLQLTAARAALLDQITAARLAELDAANIPADTDPKVMGRLQIKATTIDLGQVAGTYDLFTATTQDVVVEKLVIRMSGGTLVGSNLTSILIQTDDATPIVLIDAVAGAVANLTNEAQLAWTGAMLLDAGTSAKIRLTIAGGAATAAIVSDVICEYRAVVSGGYLA